MRLRSWAAAVVVTALAAALAACGGAGSSGAPRSPPLTVAAGACCGDPSTCRSNECAPGLHCGSIQVPSPVRVCCADGSFCCTADSDCQAYVPGRACDTHTSTCYASCADDDRRCAAGFHCEGSTCVADAVAGAACDEASDCASGNCSADFDPAATTSLCAPAAQCANGNRAWDVDYTLCSGAALARRCEAPGRWSAPAANPHPTSDTCDAGGGAASGVWAAATCASGLAGVDPGFASTCASCFPYRGATAGGCPTSCTEAPGSCWPGYHCSTRGGNACASDANGSCDADSQCTSGRCSAASRCEDKLALGSSCAKDSDCTTGWCNQTLCASPLANAQPCHRASDCATGNCSGDFDPAAATSFCAAAGECASGGRSWPVGYTSCSGSALARRCEAPGRWGPPATNPHPAGEACDAGGGAGSGFWAAAACTSGLDAVHPGFASGCVSCAPYRGATASGCAASCTEAPGSCWPGYHCSTHGGSVCASDANGSCDVDSECTSGRCSAAFRCEDKLAIGNSCAKDSDCTTGWCNQTLCASPLANAQPCLRASDCASGNCSADFDPAATTSVCAPAGECANGGRSWAVGYTLCSGSALARRCDAAGQWSKPVTNPHAAGEACDAGVGAGSGFWAAAACTSGLDAVHPGFASACVSCAPYRGATASGCAASCTEAAGSCWPEFHCSTHGGNVCASNANGSCDVDSECTSGRCSAAFRCEDKLADGGSCAKDSDCTGGWCDQTLCATKAADGQPCTRAVACTSLNCSADYTAGSTARYCAAANTCHKAGGDAAVGAAFCEGSTQRKCSAAGTWTDSTITGQLCEVDGFRTTCGPSTTCTHCSDNYMPNPTFTACRTSCSGADDAACVTGYYCNGSSCAAKKRNGAPCTRNGECDFGYCKAGSCTFIPPDGSSCTTDADCPGSGCCYQGACNSTVC